VSRESLETLRRFYDRWAVGDWSDASIFDPHVVSLVPDPTPVAQYGRDALAKYVRRFLESWGAIRIEPDEFRESGDSVLVYVRIIGRGGGSGVELEQRLFHVWTFRANKAIRMDVFHLEADALEAAGLTAF
jgi:ketosteroid isomerase-like protein